MAEIDDDDDFIRMTHHLSNSPAQLDQHDIQILTLSDHQQMMYEKTTTTNESLPSAILEDRTLIGMVAQSPSARG